MKIYIASKITGLDNYKELFEQAQIKLELKGHSVMNPSALNKGFEHAEYMLICYTMIDVCDAVYFFGDWVNSKGALMELKYASIEGKVIMVEGCDL